MTPEELKLFKEKNYKELSMLLFGKIVEQDKLIEMIKIFPGFGRLIINVVDPNRLGEYWKKEYGISWEEQKMIDKEK